MAKKGVIFNENAAGRIGVAVRHFENTYRDAPKVGVKKVVLGTRSCVNRNEVWKLKIEGTPTGGSFIIALTVNSVTENVTLNWDDTAAEVKTAFATHSELVSTDLNTVGGPFPSTEIAVEFIDRFATKRMFNSAVNIPIITDSGLTGGTGPSAKINFAQPGYPGNGNP